MGCSGLPKEEKLLENKSFIKYKNIATVEKLEPELTEDFGIIFFMELKNNKFLVSIQNGKVVIYDKKQYKPILIIDLNDYSANYIIKMKSGNFLFGCDRLFILVHILTIYLSFILYKVLVKPILILFTCGLSPNKFLLCNNICLIISSISIIPLL